MPKIRKHRIKHTLRKLYLYVRFKRIRFLLKESQLKGECIGWERALGLMQQKQHTLVSQHNKEVRQLVLDYRARLDITKADCGKDIEQIKEECRNKIAILNEEHAKEMRIYDKSYQDRCERNDAIRKDAVKLADEAKYRAQKAEDYWVKQSTKINDFIAQATGVIGIISDRYKDAQLKMGTLTAADDMVKNLSKILETISKNAHNHAPKMVDVK